MGKGTWQSTVHGVAKSQAQLNDEDIHTSAQRRRGSVGLAPWVLSEPAIGCALLGQGCNEDWSHPFPAPWFQL